MVINSADHQHQNKYVVLIDPLDGSSNIDVNVSVGTIFSVYRRVTPLASTVNIDDFYKRVQNKSLPGILYMAPLPCCYTTGDGVNEFTLNPAIGTFYLSHSNIIFPEKETIYSVNERNYSYFFKGIKDYIKYRLEKEGSRPYTSRYIGSLVSDFHRNMIKGGIYLYPQSFTYPKGKFRLLYECNPMAFIAEQAKGQAIDGFGSILDIQPTTLHQRVPFICGSPSMVEDIERFMKLNDN